MNKQCYKCKEEKNPCEFSKCKANTDGLHSWCKDCQNGYYSTPEKRAKKIIGTEIYYAKPENLARKNAYGALFKAHKINAVPLWFDKDEVVAIYLQRVLKQNETGIRHQVDHVIPLNNPTVCGLHWHGNLQVLTEVENFRKGNRIC